MATSTNSSGLTTALRLAAIGLVYYGVHHIGFWFLDPVQRISTIWPASGLALAIVLLSRKRRWPAIFLVLAVSNVISNILNGNSAAAVVGFLVASIVELGLGIWIMRRLCGAEVTFTRVVDVLALIVVATIGNACTAFIGAATPALYFNAPYWASYQTWWISDGLGILLVTPLLVVWARNPGPLPSLRWLRVIEATAFMICWGAAAWIVFRAAGNFERFPPHPYMLLALLPWAALRLGPRGVTIALLVLAAIVISSTVGGAGLFPLGGHTPTERLLMAQVYLGVTAVAGLLLATSLTQTKSAEHAALLSAEHLRRANRALRTLSNCNQELVRASEESELLEGICKVIVRDGGFKLTWVGFVKHDEHKTVAIAAHAGDSAGHLTNGQITWADDQDGQGPTGLAIRTGEPAVCHDFLNDPNLRLWRKEAIACGYNALLVLPLKTVGLVFGVLSVYAAEAEAFDAEEIELLTELADDLAYGIQALRIRVDHERAREALALSEEQVRQSQKMDAIGQLAGGVAHDFNNLLTAIIGYSAMAQASLEEGDPLRAYIEEISNAGERAASLTRQLLAFSRRQIMQPRQLDLNESVTSIAKMLQRILGEDVPMQLNLSPSELLTHADAGMLDQVLLNLAVNARDAMPGGGRLIVKTSATALSEGDAQALPDILPGNYVCLSVSDNGCGIPADNLARIFDPFFTTKETGKGTGLGLATVFGIVKQHRGAITVTSEVGRGSTFHVLLPASDGLSEAAAPDTRKLAPRGGSETIFVVEDDDVVRQLTRTLLEDYGYHVIQASNGVEALRVWKQCKGEVQLLLTDVVMPEGLSGLDLAAELRASSPELKVIFTSGYSPDLAGRELRLEEGQNFLPKPSSPDRILEIVRRCLDGAGW